MLGLERLEDRCAPSDMFGFDRVEVAPPSNLIDQQSINQWLRFELFLGQWGQGISYQPGQVIQLDLNPTQAFVCGLPNTMGREVLECGNWLTAPPGQVPIILTPLGLTSEAAAQSWEEPSLRMGWWYQDWNGAAAGWNSALMPPGPQYGQPFSPPDYHLADILLLQDNSYWYYFI